MINYLISCIIWHRCLKSLNPIEFYEAVEIQDREKKIPSESCRAWGAGRQDKSGGSGSLERKRQTNMRRLVGED